MRTSTTKYTTRAGLCAMAVVLAAALVLAGCKQEAEPSRQETQLEKDIKALAGKGPGTSTVAATNALTSDDLEYVREALMNLPDGVKVSLDLSNATKLTFIGYNAFKGCSSLASVTIPASVTSIGSNAFEGCSSLASVTIPASVTSIGSNAFASCTSLANVTIPEGVTSIGGLAFRDCTSLASVTIPESVTSIDYGAFASCTSLTNVTIPESVTSIGGLAFVSCTSLASVTIPASVTSIGSEAFRDCTSLTNVTFADSASTWTAGGYDVTVNDSLTNATRLRKELAYREWKKKSQ